MSNQEEKHTVLSYVYKQGVSDFINFLALNGFPENDLEFISQEFFKLCEPIINKGDFH